MKIDDFYDAVVIGSGPAGSTFAKTASKNGMNVLVLEKRKTIGTPVRCGEGIAEHYDVAMNLKLPESAIASRITGAKVVAPSGKSLVFRNENTKGFVLERRIFDKFLSVTAAEAGAQIVTRAEVVSLNKNSDGKISGLEFDYLGDKISVKSDLIVSAEGMEALIARQAGFNTFIALSEFDKCVQFELADAKMENEDLIELYFSTSLAPRGYVWVFPKGKTSANVGIGIAGNLHQSPKELLEKWISKNPRFSKASIVDFNGGNISVGAPLGEFTKDNFMVIGTAARQVDPIHGGGIGLALEAGEIAAQVATKAFQNKNYSNAVLFEYEKFWRAKQGEKLKKRLMLRHAMEKLNDNDFNNIIGEINQDDLANILDGHYRGVALKILAKHPELLKVLNPITPIQ